MPKTARRVLLVDDDPAVLEAMQVAFDEHGYEVVLAHDGSEGLMRAERDEPDLIVLDLVMPKRSGFSILDRIGRRSQAPLVVIVTGNNETRHRDFAKSRGAAAFIPKPFDLDNLLETVDRVLDDAQALM